MRPVLLALPSSISKVGDDQASAKKQNDAVEEYFQALIVAQMETGYGDIPEKSEHRAAKENNDTGDIFRSCSPVSGLVIVRTHRLMPTEK
jgi:hypothetical protein